MATLTRLGGARDVVAHRKPLYVRARSLAIRQAIDTAGPLDGIVAMGTDTYDLTSAMAALSIPIVTYDDGTFPLFLRYADSDLQRAGYPSKEVESWSNLQKAACCRATVCCVSTEWAKRSVVEDFGVAEPNVIVVGMGHHPRPSGSEVRDYNSPRYLFVGADWRRKNGAAVLDAFARVRRQIPRATLDIVGEHPRIDEPGATGHGFLARENAGAQALLDKLFARSTAFVLPSLFDPSPIASLEAASAGLPVIATTCGGAGELLREGAITVDPYDHEALTGAMLRIGDPAVARSMGARALAQSKQSTWQVVSRRIIKGLFPQLSSLPV
ncbi:glycosyltransferase family 4 protein [Bradyrhizobium ottawaense]|uniref:glycosyltransferase family 4 protein n=1 Tax=Bradyrhizobium ottawaense TaxID=931866 RepID=UPI0038516524